MIIIEKNLLQAHLNNLKKANNLSKASLNNKNYHHQILN